MNYLYSILLSENIIENGLNNFLLDKKIDLIYDIEDQTTDETPNQTTEETSDQKSFYNMDLLYFMKKRGLFKGYKFHTDNYNSLNKYITIFDEYARYLHINTCNNKNSLERSFRNESDSIINKKLEYFQLLKDIKGELYDGDIGNRTIDMGIVMLFDFFYIYNSNFWSYKFKGFISSEINDFKDNYLKELNNQIMGNKDYFYNKYMIDFKDEDILNKFGNVLKIYDKSNPSMFEITNNESVFMLYKLIYYIRFNLLLCLEDYNFNNIFSLNKFKYWRGSNLFIENKSTKTNFNDKEEFISIDLKPDYRVNTTTNIVTKFKNILGVLKEYQGKLENILQKSLKQNVTTLNFLKNLINNDICNVNFFIELFDSKYMKNQISPSNEEIENTFNKFNNTTSSKLVTWENLTNLPINDQVNDLLKDYNLYNLMDHLKCNEGDIDVFYIILSSLFAIIQLSSLCYPTSSNSIKFDSINFVKSSNHLEKHLIKVFNDLNLIYTGNTKITKDNKTIKEYFEDLRKDAKMVFDFSNIDDLKDQKIPEILKHTYGVLDLFSSLFNFFICNDFSLDFVANMINYGCEFLQHCNENSSNKSLLKKHKEIENLLFKTIKTSVINEIELSNTDLKSIISSFRLLNDFNTGIKNYIDVSKNLKTLKLPIINMFYISSYLILFNRYRNDYNKKNSNDNYFSPIDSLMDIFVYMIYSPNNSKTNLVDEAIDNIKNKKNFDNETVIKNFITELVIPVINNFIEKDSLVFNRFVNKIPITNIVDSNKQNIINLIIDYEQKKNKENENQLDFQSDNLFLLNNDLFLKIISTDNLIVSDYPIKINKSNYFKTNYTTDEVVKLFTFLMLLHNYNITNLNNKNTNYNDMYINDIETHTKTSLYQFSLFMSEMFNLSHILSGSKFDFSRTASTGAFMFTPYNNTNFWSRLLEDALLEIAYLINNYILYLEHLYCEQKFFELSFNLIDVFISSCIYILSENNSLPDTSTIPSPYFIKEYSSIVSKINDNITTIDTLTNNNIDFCTLFWRELLDNNNTFLLISTHKLLMWFISSCIVCELESEFLFYLILFVLLKEDLNEKWVETLKEQFYNGYSVQVYAFICDQLLNNSTSNTSIMNKIIKMNNIKDTLINSGIGDNVLKNFSLNINEECFKLLNDILNKLFENINLESLSTIIVNKELQILDLHGCEWIIKSTNYDYKSITYLKNLDSITLDSKIKDNLIIFINSLMYHIIVPVVYFDIILSKLKKILGNKGHIILNQYKKELNKIEPRYKQLNPSYNNITNGKSFEGFTMLALIYNINNNLYYFIMEFIKSKYEKKYLNTYVSNERRISYDKDVFNKVVQKICDNCKIDINSYNASILVNAYCTNNINSLLNEEINNLFNDHPLFLRSLIEHNLNTNSDFSTSKLLKAQLKKNNNICYGNSIDYEDLDDNLKSTMANHIEELKNIMKISSATSGGRYIIGNKNYAKCKTRLSQFEYDNYDSLEPVKCHKPNKYNKSSFFGVWKNIHIYIILMIVIILVLIILILYRTYVKNHKKYQSPNKYLYFNRNNEIAYTY